MTKTITFYILKEADEQALYQFVCEVIEKYFLANKTIFVWTENQNETHLLDDLLWTFKKESFIPHAIGNVDNKNINIFLGHEMFSSDIVFNIFINLNSKIPALECEQMIEIVYGSEERQQKSREKYRYYQSLGHTLKTEKNLC